MKLVVMIPCLNEEATLPLVLESMPKHIDGIDSIDILVVDDGSTDRTVEVAKSHGVSHFVHHTQRQGLAYAFRDGLIGSMAIGADIIVITDGDNQYPQDRIPDLVQPILDHKADVVIADRQTQTIEDFSRRKKFFQKSGTWFLNLVAGTNVPDATSGFRAYTKEAAQKLNLISRYSFGMETIIQSGHKRMAFQYITIKTNPKTRESRVMKSDLSHVRKSGITILRGLVTYNAYLVFFSIGLFFLIVGLIPFVQYIYSVFFIPHTQYGPRHLADLITGSILLTASFISFTLGVVADLISVNRALIEDVLTEAKRARFERFDKKDASDKADNKQEVSHSAH